MSQEDGCRKGLECEFCHLCTEEEAVRRAKRAHVARKKQREAALKRGSDSTEATRALFSSREALGARRLPQVDACIRKYK